MPTDTRKLDEVACAVGYFDADQRNLYSNAVAARWMRLRPDELRGRAMREILGEERYTQRLPHIEAVLSGVVEEFEGDISYPDGATRHVHMTLSPIQIDGRVVAFFITTIDLGAISADASPGALHDFLIAAVIKEGDLTEPLTEDVVAKMRSLLDTVKWHLAEVRHRLGPA